MRRPTGEATARADSHTAHYMVPSVAKAVSIVRHMNERAPSGVTLGEVAARLAITRSHCHNILRTLVACDWVAYDTDQRRYRLKSGLLADTRSVLNANAPVSDLRPILTRLAHEVRLLCALSRIEPDGSFIVIDKVEGGSDLGISVPVAHRFPADAPVQCKATHAWCSEAEITAWLDRWQPVARTETSIRDRRYMAEEFARTRRRGYALSDGEFIRGVMSLGLPLFDAAGRVTMVLQCPGLIETVAPRVDAVATAMQRAVAECHALLGAQPPADFPRG